MRRTSQAFASLSVAVAVAATSLAQAPAPTAPTATKSTSLARFVPRENLSVFAEFQGTDAHADAWGKSAASKILNDTTTGAMLEEIVSQVIASRLRPPPPPPAENAPPAPPPPASNVPSPSEAVAILKFSARSGLVVASHTKGAKPVVTMVFPGAMRDDASKKVFAPLVRSLTPTGGKVEPAKKPGGRTIVVASHPDGRVEASFWVENKTDLVISDDPDAVIAAIDGSSPNVEAHPTRAELMKADPGEEILGAGWVENSALGGSPMFNAVLGGSVDTASVKRATYRLALRGPSLVHDLRIVAPKPRASALSVFDGPTFDVKSLPALPEGVTELSALSLDFAKLYGQAKSANPSSEDAFAAMEATVKGKTRLRLREDVLGRLGPKVVAYASPKKAATPAGGFLSNLGSGGFQVPKGAMLIEIKDPKAVTAMLDQLMIVANREMRTQMAAASPPSEKGKTSAKGKSAAPAGSVPEFKVTLNSPKTYSLSLPTSLGAATNLRLTVVVGKKSLIVATMPDAAKEAILAESKSSSRALAGDSAKAVEGLPSGLMMMQVWDPRATLPEGLANLPSALTLAMAPKVVGGPVAIGTAKGQVPPGGEAGNVAGAGRRPGGRGGNAPGNELPSVSTGAGAGAPTPGTDPAGGSGGAANPPPPGDAVLTLRIDPALVPDPEAIRKLLAPGSASVVVDDQSIRLLVRHSFPDLAFWASLPNTMTGAVESLRGMGASGPPGTAPPGTPQGPAPPGAPARRGGGNLNGID